MKYFFIFVIVISSMLYASSSDTAKKKRVEKQIKIEMAKEKKYAKEQVFYKQENYDLKGAEVNPDSLNSIQNIEVQDDFDMDSVYD